MKAIARDRSLLDLGAEVEAVIQDGAAVKGRTNLQPRVSFDRRRKVSKMMQRLAHPEDRPLAGDLDLVDQVIL